MPKTILEMPQVTKCDAVACAYNTGNTCHAKAITIGDFIFPDCDTYLPVDGHAELITPLAGVGACKVKNCKFNRDYECTTESIQVGRIEKTIRCMTYQPR